jgi:hypothetical protein
MKERTYEVIPQIFTGYSDVRNDSAEILSEPAKRIDKTIKPHQYLSRFFYGKS